MHPWRKRETEAAHSHRVRPQTYACGTESFIDLYTLSKLIRSITHSVSTLLFDRLEWK